MPYLNFPWNTLDYLGLFVIVAAVMFFIYHIFDLDE